MKFPLVALYTMVAGILGAQGVKNTSSEYLNLNQQITISPAEGVNTKFLEFSPAYYGNGLVFVHARDQRKFIDKFIGLPFFELMYADLGPDGLPLKSKNFSPNIRTNYHEGPTCFSLNEQVVYFTRSNINSGQVIADSTKKKSTLKIYRGEKGAEDWENISELLFASDNYTIMHPTVSEDDNTIIFASNMLGGFGKYDLYISMRMNGQWSRPANLGPEINTDQNESFPFLHPRGVLFFSSEGHSGLGGIDNFAAINDDGKYTRVINLGPPFNTPKDDLSLILDDQGLSGFFASSRKEAQSGRDDIFAFHATESIFKIEPTLVRGLLEVVTVKGQPVDLAQVWLFEMDKDGPVEMQDFYTTEFSPGETDPGSLQLTKTRNQNIPPHISAQMGRSEFTLDPLKEYKMVIAGEGFQDKEITLRAQDVAVDPLLRIPLELVPVGENCIDVIGEIRNREDGKPIDKATVSIENICTNTASVVQSDPAGNYTICLAPGCTHRAVISATGFQGRNFDFDPAMESGERIIYLDKLGILSPIEKDVQPTDLMAEKTAPDVLAPGDVVVLENIYYDFNKSEIRSGSEEDLNALAQIMLKYTTMEVELSSHTDCRGNDLYNLELSERRAISAREYLTSRGIPKARIKVKSMGESQPRNECVDGVSCTDEQHQYNRRTEIKVLRIDEKIHIRYGTKRPGM